MNDPKVEDGIIVIILHRDGRCIALPDSNLLRTTMKTVLGPSDHP